MADEMDSEELLRRLDERAEYYAVRAERYRVAAEVVRSEINRPTPRSSLRTGMRRTVIDPHKSTMVMVQKVLAAATEPIDLPTLVERMQAAGWETQSETPANTVRTATYRLEERGAISRTEEGRFVGPSENQLEGRGDVNEPADDGNLLGGRFDS